MAPWICGSAELVIEMSSVAISAPRPPAATASQSTADALGSRAGAGTAACIAWESSMVARIHLGGHGQTRQQTLAQGRLGLHADAHRHALNDLREIARGVL